MSEEVRKREGVEDVIVKKLGVFGVVAMFYCVCCAGAYGVEEMIPDAGPGMALAMLIFLPFVWALPYGFICAELGSARPVEGGADIWIKEALGEFWFGLSITSDWLWCLIANTVYVVLAVQYLGKVLPVELNDMQSYIIKLTLIFIFFLINVLGLKEVSMVSTVVSIGVLIMFSFVTIVGFANYSQSPIEPFVAPDASSPVMAFGAAMAVGLWMYSGFDEISIFAGEVEDAHRVIPKALLIVIPLMILTYVLPTAAGLSSVGHWTEWSTEPGGFGYVSILQQNLPSPFAEISAVIFVIVAITGMCSIYNMCLVTASRCGLVMADENFGPKMFARLTSKRAQPVICLVVVMAATIALLGTPNHQLDFKFLVIFDAFFCVLSTAFVTVAAIILKRQIPPEEIPYKVPGGMTGHNIACALCLFFSATFALLNGVDYFIGGLAIVLLFPVIYVIAKWYWKGSTVKEPEENPIDPRTKLAFGDFVKMGGYYAVLGIGGILSRFFLQWYEEEDMVGYWVTRDEFRDDLYAQKMWEQYPEICRENPVTEGRYIPGYYETEYLPGEFMSGLLSDFYAMLDIIMTMSVCSLVAGVILFVIGKRLRKTDHLHLPG